MPVRKCDLSVVEEMTNRRASLNEISEALGVSRRTVSDARQKLEISFDLRKHPYDADVLQLSKQKKSIKEISEVLGISTRAVERARDRLKLSKKRSKLPPFEERVAQARRIYEDGGALSHAHELTRIKPAQLRKLFPDWEPWTKQEAGQIGVLALKVQRLPNRLH